MNKGVPPTAPNALAGELTPPGIKADARWNAAVLLGPADGRVDEEFAGEIMGLSVVKRIGVGGRRLLAGEGCCEMSESVTNGADQFFRTLVSQSFGHKQSQIVGFADLQIDVVRFDSDASIFLQALFAIG